MTPAPLSISDNPLLSSGETLYKAIPFDKIELAHYMPAIKYAIQSHNDEIAQIITQSEPPTFENTIETYECSGRLLDRVTAIFFNLLECDGTEEMMQLSEEIQPLISDHANDITLNEALFERISTVWQQRKELSLSDEQNMLLKEVYKGFTLSGAALKGEARDKWRKISLQLDSLTLQYGQNVLKATQAYRLRLTSEEELIGLPSFVVQSLREEAEKAGEEGWTVTLHAPSYRPFMTYSARRDLRKQLYLAFSSRATQEPHSNIPLIKQIVNLRHEKASLMQKDHFAALRLENTMAKTAPTVHALLDSLHTAYAPSAHQDIEEVTAFAREHSGDSEFVVQAWDFLYYSELLKKEKYAVDDALLKPYFPLASVTEGIFGLANRLYGLTFTQAPEVAKYHGEVIVYRVDDEKGNYIGLLYTDFFPRATKQSGAWMTEYKGQWIEKEGHNSRPHVSIVMNFSRPTADMPSLLTYDEVSTFLHEFGHALHGLLAQCTYSSLSGTNVAHDFVELPSQFMENFLTQREFLDTFARHYETGEAIPDALIQSLLKARNFQAGYLCLRQLTFGMLDMAYHTVTEEFDTDVFTFENQAIAATRLLPEVQSSLISSSFSHIFAGGYAAGYYGYKWSEVLDADAFAVFEKEGLFNPHIAKRFRYLLEKGGSVEPDELYRQFKGDDPTVEALMKRDGII